MTAYPHHAHTCDNLPSGTEEAFLRGAMAGVWYNDQSIVSFAIDFAGSLAAQISWTGAGRLTERASSCVGGSRGLDNVERRLRAVAANIPHCDTE